MSAGAVGQAAPGPRTAARSVRVDAAGRTHLGLVRAENQDALLLDSWISQAPAAAVVQTHAVTGGAMLTLAVVDGMGGHDGGRAAAGVVVTGLDQVAAAGPAARAQALEQLSDRVLQAGEAWGTPAMGATFAMLLLDGDGIRVVNAGDCQVARLVGGYLGVLSEEDRSEDPRVPGGSVVTQSLGGAPRVIDPHELALPHPDASVRYLISSDGLHHVVPAARVTELLGSGPVAQCAAALVDEALAHGAPDNVSVVVADVVVGEGVVGDGARPASGEPL